MDGLRDLPAFPAAGEAQGVRRPLVPGPQVGVGHRGDGRRPIPGRLGRAGQTAGLSGRTQRIGDGHEFDVPVADPGEAREAPGRVEPGIERRDLVRPHTGQLPDESALAQQRRRQFSFVQFESGGKMTLHLICSGVAGPGGLEHRLCAQLPRPSMAPDGPRPPPPGRPSDEDAEESRRGFSRPLLLPGRFQQAGQRGQQRLRDVDPRDQIETGRPAATARQQIAQHSAEQIDSAHPQTALPR